MTRRFALRHIRTEIRGRPRERKAFRPERWRVTVLDHGRETAVLDGVEPEGTPITRRAEGPDSSR